MQLHQYIYQLFLEKFDPTLMSFKGLRSLGIHFAQRVPKSQNLLDSNENYLVASDGAPVISDSSFLSFNMSTVSVAV